MRKFFFSCLCAALLLFWGNAGALAGPVSPNTGSDFLNMEAEGQLLYAAGFLAGINYFYLYASSERYSLPPNMTSQAMSSLLSGYLREHTDEVYQDLDYLAFKAVIGTYPLPRPWR
jgi:hypothetical protein